MTHEEQHLVDVTDIVAVEFTCTHCGSRILHPVKTFYRVPPQCPNCKEDIFQSLGQGAESIKQAVEAIKQLSQRGHAEKVRFQILCPAKLAT